MNLEGKIALVTGSGRNQGRATALEFAKEGANVVISARSNQKEADSVAEEARAFGVKALSVTGDVADQASTQKMFDKVFSEFGRVDILVNNASFRPRQAFVDISYEEWREVLGITLDGAFFCCKAVIPGMLDRSSGSIINISGLVAFSGRAMGAHAGVAKHGLHGLTRALSAELAPSGIRVNTVVPGAIDTSRDASNPDDVQNLESRNRRSANIPLRRLGLSEEVARVTVFLASDAASYVTGQSLHVNGGERNE